MKKEAYFSDGYLRVLVSLLNQCFSVMLIDHKYLEICSLFMLAYINSFSILLAFLDETSSILYYRISKGLVPPEKPSNKELVNMNRIPEWNEQQGKWKF